MPIYEYRCRGCGKIVSFLLLNSSDRPFCEFCGGKDLDRVLSRFRLLQPEATRLRDLDTRKPQGEAYYKDSRNVGLWAKKRADELGADLGDAFEEKVEKARSGKLKDLG